MDITQALLALLAIVNLVAFVVMARDKRRSRRNSGQHRAREGVLFFLAACFGSIGVYLGMLLLRHKTKKWYFQIGIPLMMIQNIATVYLAQDMLSRW